MLNEQIMEILGYWNFWEQDMETGVPRDKYAGELYRQRNLKEVSTVSGVRRSGKSTILLQVLRKIIKSGVPGENTLYVNFEEPAFSSDLNLEFILKIYDAYLEKFNPSGKTYIVLDEVQLVPGWEKFVRGLYDRNKKIKFYITGSSSKLLSREFGSALTGRTYSNEIFPLDFGEFLKFEKKTVSGKILAGKGSAELRNYFRKYMRYGGFPQVVLTKNNKDKLKILKDYYSAIIEKDIVQRYGIRDTRQLKEFCVNLVTNIASLYSAYGAEKKQKISQPTASNFMDYAREAYLVGTANFFAYSYARQKVNPSKVYAMDAGIYAAVSFRFSQNLGKIFENLAYLEFRRKQKELFYWKGKNEVDFLIREGTKIKKAVNVCWELNGENEKRETAGLLEAMEKLKIKEAEIICLDYERIIKTDGKRIKVKNYFKEFLKE